MYLLFRFHNVMPSDFYWRKPGEKIVIRAFMSKEVENREKEVKILK